VLLEGGRRERKTAAWLIAVAARTEFRNHIGELLLAGRGLFRRPGLRVALASSAPRPTLNARFLTSTGTCRAWTSLRALSADASVFGAI